MIESVRDFVMTWLDPIGVVMGLVIAVPVLWTWWQVVFGERRQRRKWLEEIRNLPGTRPGVLILDLLPGKSAQPSVRKYLAERLSEISEDRIAEVSRDRPLEPEDIADLARDIRAAARRLLDAGVDVIHLFHAGPDVSALICGAELGNGPRVLVYHFDQGQYQVFGPLEPLR